MKPEVHWQLKLALQVHGGDGLQLPQLSVWPQPSGGLPQVAPSAAQVVGVQVAPHAGSPAMPGSPAL